MQVVNTLAIAGNICLVLHTRAPQIRRRLQATLDRWVQPNISARKVFADGRLERVLEIHVFEALDEVSILPRCLECHCDHRAAIIPPLVCPDHEQR